MNFTQLKNPHRTSPFSPWISPALRRRCDAGQPPSEIPQILLVDDRAAFRRSVASDLTHARVHVIEATGVYDALRLANRRIIDFVVVRGDLGSQSGWSCAAKLCGAPPWRGVVMHFDELTEQDRRWAEVSSLARLVETGGRPRNLAVAVLQVFSGADRQPISRPSAGAISELKGKDHKLRMRA